MAQDEDAGWWKWWTEIRPLSIPPSRNARQVNFNHGLGDERNAVRPGEEFLRPRQHDVLFEEGNRERERDARRIKPHCR